MSIYSSRIRVCWEERLRGCKKVGEDGKEARAAPPPKAGVSRGRVKTPEVEKMARVLSSLEASPTRLQCWPEWKGLILKGSLGREEASGTRCEPQTVAGLAPCTQGTGLTLPLISSQVIPLEDNYFCLKTALRPEPRHRSGTVPLGGKLFLESRGTSLKVCFSKHAPLGQDGAV